MPGAMAGILGCLFGVVGIVALGLIFVPLSLLCAAVGLIRGIAGRSAAGIGCSLLAGILGVIGFATSPSLLLATGVASLIGMGLLVAPEPSQPTPPPAVQSRRTAATSAPAGPEPAGTGVCVREAQNRVVVERRSLSIGEGPGALFYNAVVTARIDQGATGNFRHIGAVAFTLFRPGPECDWVFNHVIEGVDSGRIEATRLGTTTVIHLVAASFGASGNGYAHVFLVPDWNSFARLPLPDLRHSNMGGLHVGKFGGDGPGIAVWDAIWDSGAHYNPHRYTATFYPWSGTELLAPRKVTTADALEPEPDALPVRMGWSGRDQTGQDRFARITP